MAGLRGGVIDSVLGVLVSRCCSSKLVYLLFFLSFFFFFHGLVLLLLSGPHPFIVDPFSASTDSGVCLGWGWLSAFSMRTACSTNSQLPSASTSANKGTSKSLLDYIGKDSSTQVFLCPLPLFCFANS